MEQGNQQNQELNTYIEELEAQIGQERQKALSVEE